MIEDEASRHLAVWLLAVDDYTVLSRHKLEVASEHGLHIKGSPSNLVSQFRLITTVVKTIEMLYTIDCQTMIRMD